MRLGRKATPMCVGLITNEVQEFLHPKQLPRAPAAPELADER